MVMWMGTLRYDPKNDMRSPVNGVVVSGMRRVGAASSEFRAVAALLEKAGNRTLNEKSARILEALDNAAPDLYLKHRDSGMYGINSDGELVRRLHGVPAIEQNAREALKAVAELEGALEKESPSFASSVRRKIANRNAGKWAGLLSAGKKVAGAVAVTAIGVATYLYMGYGLGSSTDTAAAVSVGAVLATGILGRGLAGYKPLSVKAPLPEGMESGLKAAIAEVKKSLEPLTGC